MAVAVVKCGAGVYVGLAGTPLLSSALHTHTHTKTPQKYLMYAAGTQTLFYGGGWES